MSSASMLGWAKDGCVAMLCASAIGCLRPAEQRAELDLQTGFASVGGVDFHVSDGLAAVRSAEPGRLHLWAQAPVLSIEVKSSAGATTEWDVRVSNCMPLSQMSSSNGAVAIAPTLGAGTTQCEYHLVLPAGESGVLRLAPSDSESDAPLTFGVFGDVQGAVDRVGDIYRRMNADPELRFVACTGDLTENGTGAQLDVIQQGLRELRVPLYSTVGNHELGSGPSEWHDRFGRASFHFAFHGVHLSFVDSGNAGIDPIVYDWLGDWLDLAQGSTHLVFTHFAPFDPVGTRAGAFRSSAEAAKLVSMLVKGKVDSTFHGHVHSYYAFSLGGIPAYISGGGGAIPETMDGIGRHYLRVTAHPPTQQVEVSIVRVD